MSADNEFVPWYSYSGPTPKAAEDTSGPIKAGNAHLLNAALHFKVPIFEDNPVDGTSLLDLGVGSSFIVTSGNLRVRLEKQNVFFGAEQENGSIDGEGEGDPNWGSLEKGSTVAIKALNFDRLHDLNGVDVWPDLQSLITEIAVLAHPKIRSYSSVARLIGIGWEESSYQENEERRYAPYLVTEFGKRGNLTDYFRYRHRNQAQLHPVSNFNIDERLVDLEGPSNVGRDTTIPWHLKLGMSFCVADALYMLHHHGVVHGDVKFENVVTGTAQEGDTETLHWKLCDFGSSILLSGAQETADNPKPYRLKSITIPWNAPEVGNPLSAIDAIKTDIYSFGYVFARIMLDGHDVFDSEFNAAGTKEPRRDMQTIEWMVAEDEVYNHVISRIESLNQYNTEQLIAIRNILSSTLRTKPSSRVACLSEIRTFLHDLDQTERAGVPPMKIHELSRQFNRSPCELCFSQPDPEKRPELVKAPTGLSEIPNIALGNLRTKHGNLKEVFYSLGVTAAALARKMDTSNPNIRDLADLGEANAHLALCYHDGYGTPYDFTLARESFVSSAGAGDLSSLLTAVFLSQAMGMPLPPELVSKTLPILRSMYPASNNRHMGEVLEYLDPDGYRLALRETCSGVVDLVPRERLSVTSSRPSDEDQSGPALFVRIVGKSLQVPTRFWLTDLHRACIEGSIDGIQTCLGQPNLGVNFATATGHTALWIACNCGNTEATKLLLNAGANPTIVDGVEQFSPLHFLSRFDAEDIPVVGKLLLEHGASPNVVSKSGETPLMFTFNSLRNFRVGSVEAAVKTLLSLGASPLGSTSGVLNLPLRPSPLKAALECLNYDTFYPIYEAVYFLETGKPISSSNGTQVSTEKEKRVVDLNKKIFLQAAASDTIMRLSSNGPRLYENLAKVLGILIDSRTRRHIRDSTGHSALYFSIYCHSFDIAEAILRNGLFSIEDLNVPEMLGIVLSTRKVDFVLDMVKAGLDLNIRNLRDENFLHLLIIHGWTTSMLQKLLPHIESKVNLQELACSVDNGKSTPFDRAVMACHFALADVIFGYGVDIDSWHFSTDMIVGKDSRTLLGRCLKTFDERTKLQQVRYLLGKKPGFIVFREMGSTALMECIRHWKGQRKRYVYPESGEVFPTELLEMLLKHFSDGEEINRRSYLGITALHVAAASGNLAATKMLLERGADINAMDNGRQTPLEAVGDQLYNLTQAGAMAKEYPNGESTFRLSNTSIEYFVMLQLYRYLLSQGAKPGTELEGEAPSIDRLPEVIEAERVHQKLIPLLKSDQNLLSNRGSNIVPVILPPPDRPDLGGMAMGFLAPELEQPSRDVSLDELEAALLKLMLQPNN
ncbi:hypothetical protein F5Y04DRAFT_193003 [Hypomontagnella monticulosa]|nr:hypothetical protein F5Y04DRAFT_193003 [Hypomontagnella monticulosa]